MYDFSACIIVYKCDWKSCKSFLSLIKALSNYSGNKRYLLRIVDNTECQKKVEAKKNISLDGLDFVDVEILYTGNNIPLSIIYNDLHKEVDSTYYAFFDHDTTLPVCFFKIFWSAENSGSKAYVPKILDKTGQVLYSPRNEPVLTDFFNINELGRFDEKMVGAVCSERFFSVTSGIVLHKEVFLANVQFDETLSFYGIDSMFWYDFQREFCKVYILDVFFEHDLSYFTTQTLEQSIWRFKERFKAQLIIGKKIGFSSSRLLLVNFCKSLAMSFKFKTYKPLLSFLKMRN